MGLHIPALCAGFLAVAAAATPAAAVTTFFDDFSTYGDTETLGINGPAAVGFFNGVWSVSPNAGSVDFLTNDGDFGQKICPTANCIDLDGSTNDAARFTTTAVFDAGTYRIDIGLFGRNPRGLDGDRERFPNDRVKLSFGSDDANGNGEVTAVTFGDIGSGDELSGTFFATIAVPSSFNIIAFGGDNVSAILTSIQLTAVPLPAALPLLAGGLGLFGLLGWRRRATA